MLPNCAELVPNVTGDASRYIEAAASGDALLCACVVQLDETRHLWNRWQADFCVVGLVDGEVTNGVAVCVNDADRAVADVRAY